MRDLRYRFVRPDLMTITTKPRYFNLTKKGVEMKYKFCWTATQYRKGWRLTLCIGNKQAKSLGFWFSCPDDIKRVLKGNIVFIELAPKDLKG